MRGSARLISAAELTPPSASSPRGCGRRAWAGSARCSQGSTAVACGWGLSPRVRSFRRRRHIAQVADVCCRPTVRPQPGTRKEPLLWTNNSYISLENVSTCVPFRKGNSSNLIQISDEIRFWGQHTARCVYLTGWWRHASREPLSYSGVFICQDD